VRVYRKDFRQTPFAGQKVFTTVAAARSERLVAFGIVLHECPEGSHGD